MTQPDINLEGFAGAQASTQRGARFQVGRYYARVNSFHAKKSEQDGDKTLYIVDAVILQRLSEKGNEPGQHVAYVFSKGNFPNAQKALMSELKSVGIGLTGLAKDLNDPTKAAATMNQILKQNLGSGKIVEVEASRNEKDTFTRPHFARVVPAAEWAGVVAPKVLAEVFGGGNEELARQKVSAIIDAEAQPAK